MSALTVIAYNVKFGDAILVVVPEVVRGKSIVRHVLIDVGNVLAGPGADTAVFSTGMQDILRRLDGRAVDLYVMTHEHLDHVQGLLRAHSVKQALPGIEYAWLTGSSHPSYYQRFPEARKRIELYRAAYDRVRLAAAQRGLLNLAPVRAFLANNNPASTQDCIAFLRSIATRRTCYVDRTFRTVPGRTHSFREARFDIWAPERDTTSYYGRMRPAAPVIGADGKPRTSTRAPTGVSQEALDALLRFAAAGLGDNMLAIDRAANNTSVADLYRRHRGRSKGAVRGVRREVAITRLWQNAWAEFVPFLDYDVEIARSSARPIRLSRSWSGVGVEITR